MRILGLRSVPFARPSDRNRSIEMMRMCSMHIIKQFFCSLRHILRPSPRLFHPLNQIIDCAALAARFTALTPSARLSDFRSLRSHIPYPRTVDDKCISSLFINCVQYLCMHFTDACVTGVVCSCTRSLFVSIGVRQLTTLNRPQAYISYGFRPKYRTHAHTMEKCI